MTPTSKRAGIYSRVSTLGQTTANQRHELEKVALQRGWEVVETYEDKGISGAKGTRPAAGPRPTAQGRRSGPLRRGHGVVGGPRWAFPSSARGFMAEMGQLGVGLYLISKHSTPRRPPARRC